MIFSDNVSKFFNIIVRVNPSTNKNIFIKHLNKVALDVIFLQFQVFDASHSRESLK